MTANETDPDTGTRSTRPEAPAEAASDAPTGNPSQPRPTLPEGMGALDRRAIDTVRVLAMDAVQKAGNGHPGTAMSVGPTAYLLFQKWLRHDPGDPDWAGRDRFVLSMGHSSLTLYIQLFLSGYGLELSDLVALRTWGSRTQGHPEVNHTPGVETTTGPLGQGVGTAVGMALEADGVPTRVVSLPCWEWFAAHDRAYREQVLPPTVRARVSVEAGVPMGWREFVGDAGRIVGLDHFGASAAYTALYEQFGLTADAVVAAARESLAAARAPPLAPTGPDSAGVLQTPTGDR